MLFVSRVTHYMFVARPTIDRMTSLDTAQDVQKGIVCEFRPGGIPAWAKESSAAQFGAPLGLAHDEDPTFRYSMYDTDEAAHSSKWTPAVKAEVEDRLLNGMSYGVDYVQVTKPKLKAPWPNYDKLVPRGKRTPELVAQQIAEKVSTDGYDPYYVLSYESENQNRLEVIKAVEHLIANPVVEAEEELIEA